MSIYTRIEALFGIKLEQVSRGEFSYKQDQITEDEVSRLTKISEYLEWQDDNDPRCSDPDPILYVVVYDGPPDDQDEAMVGINFQERIIYVT